jgi:HK97 family phage major capsid protein
MTPRYTPPAERKAAIKRERDRQDINEWGQQRREVDRDYAERSAELERERQSEQERLLDQTQERIRVRDRSHYGPGSEHSYFRDLIATKLAEQRRAQAEMHPGLRGGDPAEPLELLALGHGGAEEARKRLASVETRDVTTADPGARSIVPVAAPDQIALEVANSATHQATLAAALRKLRLPEVGKTLELPSVTTGPSVTVQATEGGTVAEVDFDAGSVSVPIATISGQTDITRQAFERSGWEADVVIAAELGRKYGQSLDSQFVSGSGASGQLLGLATVSGILSVTYTDASPTAAKTVSKAWSAYSSLANTVTGYGTASPDAYVTVMHPRRYASLFANQGGTVLATAPLLPGTTVPCGGIRTNLGAGTNEDEVFVVERSQAVLFNSESRLRVHEGIADADSGSLKVRVSIVGYAALAASRQPTAAARVSGTGLTPPSL